MRRMGSDAPDVHGRWPTSSRWTAAMVLGSLLIGGVVGAAVVRAVTPGPPPAPPPITAGVPGVGASSTSQRIPVGYARTRLGAAEAVGNYLAALGGPLALDRTASMAALDRVADPAARVQLAAGLDGNRRALEGLWGVQSAAQAGKRVMLTQTPIAYRVTSYTDNAATIAVWLVTTVGVDGRQPLAAAFANGSGTVAWLDGDWRLQAIATGSASGDVVPACLQTPTPTGGVPSLLDGFVPYGS